MILGIGLDLCDVARMESALARGGFVEKYCTPAEAAYIRGRGKGAAQSLAGHFAAKEAALKALGCGIVLPLTDVEVRHDHLGAPRYALAGEALARLNALGGRRVHLSITHTDGLAAAVAVIEG